tara:strand:- start:49 stop:1515 length:1467 start_codon:yes stop_codon:yes gene_type:complete
MKGNKLNYLLILFCLIGCNKQSENKNFNTLLGTNISQKTTDDFIENQMELLNMPALSIAIINDGEVVYHRVKGYDNKEKKILANNQSIFEGASISKSVFGFFVMTFVEDGILDLDKALFQYLPNPDIEYDERYKKITARMVLSHRSGFPNWRYDYPDKKLFIQFEPDTDYHYSGEGYQYLAEVLKHILNTNWAGLETEFQKRVAIPFKMEHTKFIKDDYIRKHKVQPYDKNGNWIDKNASELWRSYDSVFVAPTTIHSESIDFSKWMIGMMNEKELTKKGFQELFKTNSKVAKEGFLNIEYSLGFNKLSILNLKTLYQHNGNNTGFSSFFMFDKEKKWGLVYFTNSKFGDAFGQELIYGLLMTGWTTEKQIAMAFAITLSVIFLLINLVLIFFKNSENIRIRRNNLKIGVLVCLGVIASLFLMLVTNIGSGIYVIYLILLLATIILSLKSLRMINAFWKEKRVKKFELTLHSLLLFGILISVIIMTFL